MANFDTGLLGFPNDDEDKFREYMIQSLRPDIYGGFDISQLDQMQDSAQPPAQSMEQPTEIQVPQTAELSHGLLGNVPQQEQQQVEVQATPDVMVPSSADDLAHAATSGATDMAQYGEQANQQNIAAGKQLAANKDAQAQQTMQMALAEQRRKEQEEQGLFSQILGTAAQILPLFI
jgi:hypothetical protein